MSNIATKDQPTRGAWQKELEQRISSVVLPELERSVSPTRKAEILGKLVKDLKGYVGYDKYDPKQLSEFTAKRDYKCVDQLIGHDRSVWRLHALPDGKIVSGSWDKSIRIWSKDQNDVWTHETVGCHGGYVCPLQALPDGRIVSGSSDNSIRIWDGSEELEQGLASNVSAPADNGGQL